MEERRYPQRRRRRRRINWTGVIFWLVVLAIIITVIALLVRPKNNAEVPEVDGPDSAFTDPQLPQQSQKPEKPTVEATEAPTNPPTDPPTDPPTEPPTEAPTDPPTEPPTEAPTSPPTEATAGVEDPESYSSVAEMAVAVAKSALGMPFEYGGSGPGTFDTSGLIYYCFNQSGIPAPRLVSDQAAYGSPVEKANLQPGDVVFFYVDTPGTAEYVGIYIGNGAFIAARSSQNAIGQMDINSPYFTERYVCARRYY